MKEKLIRAIFDSGYVYHKDITDIAYKKPNQTVSFFLKTEYKDTPKSKHCKLTILCFMKDDDNYISSELSEIFVDNNDNLEEIKLSEKIKEAEIYMCKIITSKKTKQQ